jgi:hypothetical protein
LALHLSKAQKMIENVQQKTKIVEKNEIRKLDAYEFIVSNEDILRKYYYDGAALRQQQYQHHLVAALAKLEKFPFKLDFEDMIGDSAYGFDFGPSRYYAK